jgi:sodium/hydrogen antiporter
VYDLALLIVGLLALASAALPTLLRERLVTFPVLVIVGGLVLPFAFPDVSFDPVANGFVAEHLTEFAVIIALTGLGLAIDRPVSWRGWMTAWRLLAITMPLSIVAAAFVGWWVVGLAPAAALLFGASLAPTDPVLAVDVQTGPPDTGSPEADEDDEVRLGLTSESSLNDGLAFPFTNLAILVAIYGFAPSQWGARWLLDDVIWKIGGGVAVGWLVGRLLTRVVLALCERVGGGRGLTPTILALALTLASYGVAELVQTYGFIAVFVTAVVIRDAERTHDVHDHLHEGAHQLELLAMSLVVLLLGAALADGLWEAITWPMIVAAVLLIFVARPVAGMVGLVGHRDLLPAERGMVAFFGIRGLGSLYYLAYGINHADFGDTTGLWALMATVVVLSLVVHGLSARPAMRWLERHRASVATG